MTASTSPNSEFGSLPKPVANSTFVQKNQERQVVIQDVVIFANRTLFAQTLLNSLHAAVSGLLNHFRFDDELKDVIAGKASFKWPDVAIIDCDASGHTPFETAKTIRQQSSSTRIVLIASYESDLLNSQAKTYKADGVVLKTDSLSDLIQCLQIVGENERWISPSLQNFQANSTDDDKPTALIESLTNRQLEVLSYIAQGYTVKEIAKLMFLSEKSVDSHKYRIMNRLGIHDRVKLALFAVRENLINPQF